MKMKLLGAIAVATLLAGCTGARQEMGAPAENDQNVLTGGPMVGTTIADLPQPVKDTLQSKVPHAEVADIDKTTSNGQVIYRISFLNPGEYPTLYVRDDGKVVSGSD